MSDKYDEFRNEFGAERVDNLLASLGLGPKYKPRDPVLHTCNRCGKHGAFYTEVGADCDAGQNEMVLYCPHCKHRESS
jgi:DNA-directed RNA polymerase subunit RPC12/RpoP